MVENAEEDSKTTESNQSTEATVDIEAAKTEAVNGLLKEMGVDSTDSLKGIVEAQNETSKANQTDLENSQSDLKKANDNNLNLSSQVTSLLASNAVLKAGITSEHMEDATILAQAKVNNGSAKDFDKAIADVIKSNPQFKGTQIQTGSDGAALDGSNKSNNQTELTREEFEKMNYGQRLKVFTEQPEKYKEFTNR
ncbi:hypothetical protein M5C72_07125 [Companilactobacillus allii]|uniref:Uncharacterized protein n=1 Tax=Companilactobacillus allii TaxID=1847728 RepID=A0A1P8Q4X8_9LACO|nr:hypothetical protein [Companilactobacillus allii]APX72869.1 hypothetical protein BTM29_10040 [Companilactobacillus allii]USQ67657.1 hypothetical protein M5C72_07125 [Companilactobacillus allii]